MSEPKKVNPPSAINLLINEEIGESISASSDSQSNRKKSKSESELDEYSQNFESSSSVFNNSGPDVRVNSVESEVIEEIPEISSESLQGSKSSFDKEVYEGYTSSISWASLKM